MSSKPCPDLYTACDHIGTVCSGPWQEDLLFLQEKHLKNPVMWRTFVSQFRDCLDTPSNEKNGGGKWLGGWRGEYWGKSMRGAVSVYRVTKDEELYRVMTATVEELLRTAGPDGIISTYFPDEAFGLWDLWCRKYVLLGLEYFYEICRSDLLKEKILSALCRNADCITSQFGEGRRSITDAGHPVLGGLNAASLLEPMVKLYALTENGSCLHFAEYIVSTGFSSLENIYLSCLDRTKAPFQFKVRKAYEMMSCMEGLLELYRMTGRPEHLAAVENFAQSIAETDVTVIGGCGCDHERLDRSAVTQTDPSVTTLKNETCVTVTWMKLCIRLLKLTGKACYADLAERSAWNALRGAVNTKQVLFDFDRVERYRGRFFTPENGMNERGLPFDSYSPLLPGMRGQGVGGLKQMQNGAYYGCCACIGGAGVGLFADASVLSAGDGFVFNFYLGGKVHVKAPDGKELCAEIFTDYPFSETVRIRVLHCSGNVRSLYFRIPSFSRNTVLLYNRSKQKDVFPGRYYQLKCSPAAGDEFRLTLDMDPRAVFQNGYASFLYGNVVLGFDERFGYCLDDRFELCGREEAPVPFSPVPAENGEARFVLRLKNGSSLTACDYGSAGKDWYNGCRIAAWIRAENGADPLPDGPCKIADDLI